MGGRVAIEIAGKGARTGLADRVVAWLVVAMPVLSLAALAIGMWRTGSLWTGIADALAVAVVICPCALTIAQPLAHLRAVGRGAREGLRIADPGQLRSEEQTSELQSLMRNSYAVFCLKNK